MAMVAIEILQLPAPGGSVKKASSRRALAAELADEHDQRLVEQAAPFEIGEQRRDRLVDLAGLAPQTLRTSCDWWSQPSSTSCTKRTPRSMRRRAVKQLPANEALSGSAA